MNKRHGKVLRYGKPDTGSFAVTLPKDWVRGNGIESGDTVEVWYDGDVIVKAPPPKAAP